MPSLPDGIVIFVLALLLFGPKRLPVLARELGKWIGEFRRASNEFKMQMEDELRVTEQADRQKEIAAMQAAAPVVLLPGVPTEDPEHPHAEPFASGQSAEPAAVPLPIATAGELKLMPPDTGLPTARESGHNSAYDPPAGPDLELGLSSNIDPLLQSIPVADFAETHPENVSPATLLQRQETTTHG